MSRLGMSNKDVVKYDKEVAKLKVYCKCGHSLIIPVYVDSNICHHCGHRVYRTPQIEFKEKLKKELRGKREK